MTGISPRFRLVPALICAATGAMLFQFWGNAARGYIDTRSLFFWWGRQWFDPASEAQHGPLIILAALWLFWRNLRRASSLPDTEESPHPAAAALLGGVALHVLAYAMQQTRLSVVALLLFAWGILRLAGGPRWSKSAVFPLAFILLAIPISFLQPVGFYLRLWVSQSSDAILHRLGFGVVRSGTQLFALDGKFQYDVAAACSGIRSLVALFALSLLLAYVRLKKFWTRTFLVALTLPYAFAGNFLRIFVIVLAGQLVGQTGGERVHASSGFVIFAVFAGLILLSLRSISNRFEPSDSDAGGEKERSERRVPLPASRGKSSGRAALRVAGLTAVGALAGALAIERLEARPPQVNAGVRLAANGIDPAPLPDFLGTEWIGQRVEVTRAERDVLPPDTGYSRRNYVSVQDRQNQVFVSIVLSGRDRSSIHRPELCVVGQGWNIVSRTDAVLRTASGGARPVTLLRIERDVAVGGKDRVKVASWLAYWFVGRDTEVPSHAAMIWRSSLDRLLHFRADRWAYVIAQTPGNVSEDESLSRMALVLDQAWPAVGHRSPPTDL